MLARGFYVDAYRLTYVNRGTSNESKHIGSVADSSGPFETRESAEAFARALATQPDLGRVSIRPARSNE